MRRLLLIIIGVCTVLFIISTIFTDHADAAARLAFKEVKAQAPRSSGAAPAKGRKAKKAAAVTDATFEEVFADSSARWRRVLAEMPEPTEKIAIHLPGNLREIFNDSNRVHWEEAERLGIKPLTDTRSHFRPGRPLVKVEPCADFYVDELTHSAPYLVPEAAATLHEIGRRFNDSLRARGGGDYRIRVTSVLRTPSDVMRLRRSNRNAVDSSVHQMATTVDITYTRFACGDANGPHRSAEDLKNLLGEVLLAMRAEGKIWVKFEQHQPCYHITARKPAS